MRFLVALALSLPVFAQPVLRFKVTPPLSPSALSPVTPPREGTVETRDVAASLENLDAPAPGSGPITGHLVVQFSAPPTAETVAELRVRGAPVLGDVPDNALLIVAREPVDLRGLGVTYAAPLDPGVKISPLLERPASGSAEYLVELHPDVDLNRGRSLILNLGRSGGLELRENPDLGPHRLLVRVRFRFRGTDPVAQLAAADEVAYVFPASQELQDGIPSLACSGPLTGNGGLAQYIAAVGHGWDGPGRHATSLGYVFSAPTSRIPAAQAEGEILRAMREWSSVIALDWQVGAAATAARTVNILFGRGSHGDDYPFDGRGNILAHTFYPAIPNPEPLAGDMHLDEDEPWRIGTNIDLYSVALHELGHALGLGHSDDPTAVMYPYYRMQTALQAEDRRAILSLYAAAPDPPGMPTAPATPTIPTTPAIPTTPVVPTTPFVPTAPTAPTAPAIPTTPTPTDRTAPTLRITSPATSVSMTSLAVRRVAGTAADAGGLDSVTWTTSAGASGRATGTTQWSAEIPLLPGINQVIIRATDRAGNTAWRSLVLTRK